MRRGACETKLVSFQYPLYSHGLPSLPPERSLMDRSFFPDTGTKMTESSEESFERLDQPRVRPSTARK